MPSDDDSTVAVVVPPHSLVRAVTTNGTRIDVSRCMLARLDGDDLEDGRVPADMPEYDVPVGSGCHADWRGGCPVDGTRTVQAELPDDGGDDGA